jgi:hypothetical protein
MVTSITRRDILKISIVPLTFPLLNCGNSQSDLTLALTALEGAAEVALTTLLATNGISQAEFNSANNYLTEITTFVDFLETEIPSTDTVLQKAAAVTQELIKLGLSTSQLPPGLPTIILSVFAAVLKELALVYSSVQVTTSLLLNRGINSFASQKKWNGKLSRKDKDALADVAKRNTVLKAKLKK